MVIRLNWNSNGKKIFGLFWFLTFEFHLIYQILEEIKRRDIVEDVINPVFTINLVLNVPTASSKSQRSKSPDGAKKGKGRVKFADDTTMSDEQKSSSFQDDESS